MPPESEELVTALSASLVLMEKGAPSRTSPTPSHAGTVLNDVLDFNRMEAGRLVIQNRAFDLHKVFQSIALAFRGPVAARKLQLVADLDPAIDAYCPIVRGDETRLLQILSNLLSNSCKFTSSGTIRYSTRLLHPSTALREQRRRQIDGYSTPTQRDSLAPPPSAQGTPRPSTESSHPLNEGNVGRSDLVIVRIEVADSGVGIKRRDLQGDSFRLFSPYIQTEIGQRQGGKGAHVGSLR
jgi:signal transduction histidine kinase